MVELLIVITIIAALMALTVAAAMRFIPVAEVKTTETLVHKLHDVFDKHWKAVIAKANQETIPQAIVNLGGPFPNISNNETEQNQRARVLYIKLRLLREFPMSVAEAISPQSAQLPYLLPPNPTYVKALTGVSFNNSAAECSACLLLALSQARAGITTNPEDFGSGTIGNVATNNAGIRGFIDSWGQPIVFCRWPTGNAEVKARNPAPAGSPQAKKLRDPQDPTGLLLNPLWLGKPNYGVAWSSKVHQIADGDGGAIYTEPVIWSFGPDKQPGLTLGTMALDGTNKGYENDNIFSYRLRLGGS